ncbi:hypothetical protein LDFHOB_08200 [Candidatus Electronema aureum]|jgi:hypothetical protein
MKGKLLCSVAAALLSFSSASYAAGIFSTSNLKVGSTNLSISNNGKVLTKTDASTGKWLGQQNFASFYGMMFVPERDVLLVSGVLEGGSSSVLVKIKKTGGTGQNMFALKADGGSVENYNYRIGSQAIVARSMSYENGKLFINNGKGVIYKIADVGGSGYNMFALVNETSCESMPNYNYFLGCSYE